MRAVYVVREGFLTLVDLILLVLTIALLVFLPYRLFRLKKKLKALPGPQWRNSLLMMWVQSIIDLPFIAMLLLLIICFPAGLRLKRSIQRK